MKKTVLALVALVGIASADAQTFRKGDIVVDANIGIGVARDRYQTFNSSSTIVDTEKSNRVTFTQRLGVEFGVWDINETMGLGIGIDFQNANGSTKQQISGFYDYDYTFVTYDKVINSSTNRPGTQYTSSSSIKNRQGAGQAMASAAIMDFNLTMRAVYHIELMDRLDAYGGIGFGVARVKYSYSNFDHLRGFAAETKMFDSKSDAIVQFAYSYDDLEHVKWQEGDAKGRFAYSLFLGARYYFNDHWALNGELGLPVVTFQGGYNHYNIFSVGASYKF